MQYDMVFEGGGAKGMVFVGALQELEARGHSPARLMGASAGAIMATFLAAGYNSTEMAEALNEQQDGQPVFLGFLETPPALTQQEIQNSTIRQLLRDVNLRIVPDFVEEALDDTIATLVSTTGLTSRVFSFLERGGFYAAQNFLDWLRTKMNSGTYTAERGAHPAGSPRQFGDMNLAEFHTATGVDLSLIGSDTTGAQLLILNHRTAPECPLVWAVRMSMSFPLLWHEVVWQKEWGPYRGRDLTGHTIVDGGMLSNFPLELFLSNQEHVTAVMGEKIAEELSVIGFLIDETLEVEGAEEIKAAAKKFDVGALKPVMRVQNLINTMTQAHDKLVIDAFEQFVVRLPAKGYGTIEFGMTETRRQALVAAGRKAARTYFERMATRGPGGPTFEVDPFANPLDTADKIATRILEP